MIAIFYLKDYLVNKISSADIIVLEYKHNIPNILEVIKIFIFDFLYKK